MARNKSQWPVISKAAGLIIIFSLLIDFIYSSLIGRELNSAIVLALLSIGGVLVGVHSGYTVVKRNGKNGTKDE